MWTTLAPRYSGVFVAMSLRRVSTLLGVTGQRWPKGFSASRGMSIKTTIHNQYFPRAQRHLRWEAFRDNARPASRIFTAKWARSSVKRGHTTETTLRNLTTVAAPTQREQLRARDGCLFHYLLLASSNKQHNAAHRIGMGLWPHRHRKFHDQSTRHSPHRKRRGH